ncbi:MAG TPA: ABC transporter ATP-binding protein [Hyphomicrobiaceae bacterium]|nr:ABC transporter ATP-binding protein [Hyphomicrobiaceae bacterium]
MADRGTAATPVLETEALCRNFGGLAAVRDVAISVHQGQLHAVIGPNGAGKSTLVNLLSGALKPSSGRIHLMGREITGEPAWRMAHLGVGRSFQRTNILGPLTVLENVRLGVQAVATHWRQQLRTAASERALVERAEAILAQVGLAEFRDRPAATLAHGSQRQLEIALAIAGHPKLLLLDEPLAGMGPEESERMIGLLKGLARDHAILLVEHDMDFVFAVADRMTVMVDGAVLAHGSPDEIRASADVQRAYLGGAE